MPASSLPCLLDVFETLKSSRAARGTRFPLHSTLALILVAVLAGCKNYSQIYAFARGHRELLKQLGFRAPKYPRKSENRGRIGAPNEDTLARIVASVDSRDLNEGLARFLARHVARGAQAAIDDKALRGADDYVLSVFVNDLCQVVWQEKVGVKENELSCLEHALDALLAQYPGLKLFTGDAAFCHKSLARRLIEAKRDYFLQLKAPHTTDLGVARKAFEQLRCQRPLATSVGKRGARAGRKS